MTLTAGSHVARPGRVPCPNVAVTRRFNARLARRARRRTALDAQPLDARIGHLLAPQVVAQPAEEHQTGLQIDTTAARHGRMASLVLPVAGPCPVIDVGRPHAHSALAKKTWSSNMPRKSSRSRRPGRTASAAPARCRWWASAPCSRAAAGTAAAADTAGRARPRGRSRSPVSDCPLQLCQISVRP